MPEQNQTPALPLPQKGGSYERLPDGSLRLIEATDHAAPAEGQGTATEESPQ